MVDILLAWESASAGSESYPASELAAEVGAVLSKLVFPPSFRFVPQRPSRCWGRRYLDGQEAQFQTH